MIFPDSGLPDTLGAGENISNYVGHDEINNLGKIIIKKMLEKNREEDFLGPRVRLFLRQMFAKKIKFELSLKSKLRQQNKQIIEYDKLNKLSRENNSKNKID